MKCKKNEQNSGIFSHCWQVRDLAGDFPGRSVHTLLSLYLRNDVILFLHPYSHRNPRLSHQFSLCIASHPDDASVLIKAALGLLCFLAFVYVRARLVRGREYGYT